MSILVVFLRSYFFKFSHDVIFDTPIPRSTAVPWACPVVRREGSRWRTCGIQACNVIEFIERVRSYLILWDTNDDAYKLAEKKHIGCEKTSKHSAIAIDVGLCIQHSGIYLSNDGINVTLTNLTLDLSLPSKMPYRSRPVSYIGDEIFHRWSSLTILLPPDRSTSSNFVMNIHKLLPVQVFSTVDSLHTIVRSLHESLMWPRFNLICSQGVS